MARSRATIERALEKARAKRDEDAAKHRAKIRELLAELAALDDGDSDG